VILRSDRGSTARLAHGWRQPRRRHRCRGAGFGGPAGAWLIMGIGLCTAMLGAVAFTVWQQRRSVVRP